VINSVGIVGYGHFGKFLRELGKRFFPEVEFRVYSRRAEVDEQTFYSLETVAQSDVVIFCGAIREYEAQLVSVLPHVRPETIVVDVATVKKHTNQLLRTHCGDTRFISTHPMFGPESYKKHRGNVDGFRIVVTDHVLTDADYLQLKHIFTTFGFLIIEMTADEHDKHLAETLFLTHYVGQSILKAGFNRTPIDTPSFQFLMDAVESVKYDQKLFTDVYRFNQYCKDTAKRLHAAQEAVYSELRESD
jgi:prephenate dehydrogenase